MTPLQAARSFDDREGFDVVDFAEVGLPIFRLTVEAVTLGRQDMPTTHEFVLRSIILGEKRAGDIAGLLGLPVATVEDALAALSYDKCIALMASDDDSDTGEVVPAVASAPIEEQFAPTEYGVEKMRLGEQVPRDEPLVFDFDGIRRRPIMLGSESIRRPRELSDLGAIQIRPYPVDAPDASDLQPASVARVVRRKTGKEFERTVLLVRRIARRETYFRMAVAVVYRSRTTDEIQIGFVLGDQIAEDYEIEFAKHGGPKKPGFVRDPSGARATLRAFLGADLADTIANGEETSRLRLAVTNAFRERSVSRARLELVRQRSVKDGSEEMLAAAERSFRAAQEALDALPLRPLAVYEQWELFGMALGKAKHRLYVSSSDVDGMIADGHAVRQLNERVDGGVEVRIDTSVVLGVEPKGAPGSFEPGVELWLASRQKRGLTLRQRPTMHHGLYFLIKDEDLAIVSNRPFLCGRDLPLCFVPTVGVVTRHPELVRSIARLVNLDTPNDGDGRRG